MVKRFVLFLVCLILVIQNINAQCYKPTNIKCSNIKNSTDIKLFKVALNNKYGYINDKGIIVIKPIFDYAGAFFDGLAYIKLNNKYGYIDKTGKIIIKPIFDNALDFTEGLAGAKLGGRWGYINRNGKFIIKPKFITNVSEFSEGLAGVQWNYKVGFINHKGEWIIKPQFTPFMGMNFYFYEGLACINLNNKWGFINKNGDFTIQPIFKFADGFNEGLSNVYLENGNSGYINHTGKMVIKPIFNSTAIFKEGLASVGFNNNSGFINKKGDIVITLKPDEVGLGFSEGLSAVRNFKTYKVGYINRTGKYVIPFNYTDGFPFKNGLAKVSIENGDWGYIDKKGKWIWKPTH